MQGSSKSKDPDYYTGNVSDDTLVKRLDKAGVEFKSQIPDTASSLIMDIFITVILPIVLLVFMFNFLMKKMSKGGGMMGIGKSNAKMYMEKQTGVTFLDVAGEDEAKESLQEVVDFLHNPQKYQEIGAVCPKGALLVGPPGTGKKPPAHGRKAHSSAYLQVPLRNCGHSPWPERRPSGLLSCRLLPARRRWHAAGRWYQPPHRSGILPRSLCHLLK